MSFGLNHVFLILQKNNHSNKSVIYIQQSRASFGDSFKNWGCLSKSKCKVRRMEPVVKMGGCRVGGDWILKKKQGVPSLPWISKLNY